MGGMAQPNSINRVWIAAELVKGVNAERSLAVDAQARADSPPDAALSVLYHEIATADERHATIIEKIAVRYGHTPSPTSSGGIGPGCWDSSGTNLSDWALTGWTN